MAAALLSLTSLYILLGVAAGLAALCAFLWAVCHCQDGAAKDEGVGGGVSSAAGRHEGLLNKSNKDVVVAVPEPGGGCGGGGQGQQRGAGPDGGGEVEVCAICKARLAEAGGAGAGGGGGWGGCRRLRPCGHVYHADCIGLWLQRRWICPVCRAGVVLVSPPAEIIDAMV